MKTKKSVKFYVVQKKQNVWLFLGKQAKNAGFEHFLNILKGLFICFTWDTAEQVSLTPSADSWHSQGEDSDKEEQPRLVFLCSRGRI